MSNPFAFPDSRPGAGARGSEAKEAEGASQVEAGKRLEELRRRRGETESEEFEKLKQKQQEAAQELEELKKKREERRKVLEEEEQKRKQEEAERKVREEVRRAQPAWHGSCPGPQSTSGNPSSPGNNFFVVECCCSFEYGLLQIYFKNNKVNRALGTDLKPLPLVIYIRLQELSDAGCV